MRGVIDCNEWKTEKRHECANMGKVKTTRIMMATVPHVTSGSGLRKFQARWIFVGQSVHYCVHKSSPPPVSVLGEIHLVNTPRQPISWRSILHFIWSSHLRLCLTSGFLSSGLPSITLYSPSLSSMRVTCLAHQIPLDLITGIVFGE